MAISKLAALNGGLTLTERVYGVIRDAILDLSLEVGSPLVEEELAKQLGTSKTPVRDALLALERDGLVTRIPYKGTYVTEVSVKDATEIFELRAVLEGLAARLAARNVSPKVLDEAEDLLDKADEELSRGNGDGASAYGVQFHELIHTHADNSRLKPILENLESQLQRLRRLSDQVQGRLEKSSQEHRAILAALRTGDPAAAEQSMLRHLASVVNDFRLIQQ